MYELLPYLSSALGEYKEFARSEYYFYCPFCHHYNPKLAVNLSKGKWHCWKCGAAGNKLISLIKKLNFSKTTLQEIVEILGTSISTIHFVEEETDDQLLVLPEEYLPLWNTTQSYEYQNALKFVQLRGLTKSDIFRYQIGFCASGRYAGRIIFPSFDSNNKLNYFVARDYRTNSIRPYINPPVSKNVVGFENQINWKYSIVLCEGVLDAIAIRTNAIPMFGKIPSRKLIEQILKERPPAIYIALDYDAAEDSEKIISFLIGKSIKSFYVTLPENHDPSDLGFNTMRSLIKQSTEVDFINRLKLKLT